MGGNKDYIVGRGKVYFDMFPEGSYTSTGEMYFGNTPTFSLARAQTNLDHFDSDAGLRVKDYSLVLEDTATLSFGCDDIAVENLAVWWSGAVTEETQVSGSPVPMTITAALDRYYQLGTTPALPQGVRNVTLVTVTIATTPVLAPGNWEVDLPNGRFHILPGATGIEPDDVLTVTYTPGAGVRSLVIGGNDTLYGAIRFISANEGKKKQRNYYFPYVKLGPDGDFNLKGDDWQIANFTAEVLTRPNYQRVYIDAPA